MIPETPVLATTLSKIARKVEELSTAPLMHPSEFGVLPEHTNDNQLFEELTFQTFKAGFSRKVVVDKWPEFQRLFQQFDIETVANFSEQTLEDLTQDRRIIRNRKKIAAAQHNAEKIVAIQVEHGSFRAWLDSFGVAQHQVLQQSLVKEMATAGPVTAYWFMVACDYPLYFCNDGSKRLLARLGWLSSEKAKPDEVNALMLACYAASDKSLWELSHDLARFSSGYKLSASVCKEGTPVCAKCPLWDECALFNA